MGEKSLRQIIEDAQKVAERCLPQDRHNIAKICSDLNTMTDALCELRQDGKGATPQAESLARGNNVFKIVYDCPQKMVRLEIKRKP